MAKRSTPITPEMREQAWIMHTEGKKTREIADTLGISHSSVYNLTNLRERGFHSTTAYQKERASRRAQDPRHAALRTLFNDSMRNSGYNSYSLGKLAGVAKQTIHDYVHGRAIPQVSRLMGLLEIMGVSSDKETLGIIYPQRNEVPQEGIPRSLNL